MKPEMVKQKAEELSREELITLIYEMAKEISELKAEIARLKQSPTTGVNDYEITIHTPVLR